MDIREFRYYQFLAENGFCEPVVCLNDIEHGSVLANVDENDNLYLYCLACTFKMQPGLAFSDFVRNKIMGISREQLKLKKEEEIDDSP